MQPWSSFYAATAGASATLLGLLFVAVSISAAGHLGRTYSTTKGLAEQAFQNYLSVLMISAVALFPAMDASTIGTIIGLIASSRAIWAIIRLRRSVRHGFPDGTKWVTLQRHAISMLGLSLVLVSAVRLSLGKVDSFHALAAGVLVLLASSAAVSWELLLRLIQARATEDAG